jgi:predicted DNA-binding protein YlxM (UPF0122 family)
MTSGIQILRKLEQQEIYSKIYEEYLSSDITLQDLGQKYGITRQRVSQIVIRCKVVDGDYYSGGQKAKDLWDTISEDYRENDSMALSIRRELFRSHLEQHFDIKIAKNNHKFTLLLGRNYAKRKPTLEATAG